MKANALPAQSSSLLVAGSRRFAKALVSTWTTVLGFLLLFLAWQIASDYVVRSVLFPTPIATFAKMAEMAQSGDLFVQIAASLRRILIGFVAGSIIAVPIGLAIGSFSMFRRLVEPWTEFLRFIPAVAMITIAVIWFGIGEESKIFLIIYATVFIVILNTAAGVSAITPNKIRAAQVLGASQWQIFAYVSLPATVPYILTGMRLAMANAFTTIVSAEMVAANAGLGVMLWNGRMFMLVEEIFVSLLCLGALGFATDRLFRFAIFRFAGRFSPNA
jgi:NitT/TauT family transport system permease protein